VDNIDYPFWIAVLAIAVVTWLTRALPFFGGQRRLDDFSKPGTPLSMLGPSLLAAICTVVIIPDLLQAVGNALALPYVLGLLVTAAIACSVKNTGIAVLGGIAAYGIFLFVGTR
jgi:branched-subunit amino acid transport protein